MTVTTQTSRVEYAGNGVTTAFSVPFYFLESGHLDVYVDESEQVLTTQYTVSGAGHPAGGTVTFISAPANGSTVIILRDPPITQMIDYAPNDPFPAESHEVALDKLTMICQRLLELVDRSCGLPDYVVSSVNTRLPDPEALHLIGWNEAADALQNFSVSELASVATYGDYRFETFSGDGSATDFTLQYTPVVAANCDVSIDGVTQVPGIDYTLLGDSRTLRFSPAPGSGTVILVRYGRAVEVPVGSNVPETIIIACSDETTALTAGTAKVTFRMPYAMALSEVRASLTTAQASGNIFTVDVNESGTSILSTKLTIDNTEKTSRTAATPAVISDSSLALDAEISIDIDQIGNGTAAGLKVTLVGVRA